MAYLAGWIQQSGRWHCVHLGHVVVLFARGHITLFSRRGRKNGEPHHSAPGPLLLQTLHVAAVILLPDVGASVVVPFEHNILSKVCRELNRLAVACRSGEVRRSLANSCSRDEQRS